MDSETSALAASLEPVLHFHSRRPERKKSRISPHFMAVNVNIAAHTTHLPESSLNITNICSKIDTILRKTVTFMMMVLAVRCHDDGLFIHVELRST